MLNLLALTLLTLSASASDVVLESFDHPTQSWHQTDDPVMGGKSTGTFTVHDGVGSFVGEVVDVPFLKAPGFIKVAGSGGSFSDVSSCTGVELTVRTNSSYAGYRFSFGNAKPPGGKFFAYGYKAHFTAPSTFGKVVIPFTNFSDYWDDATGKLIKTCQDDKVYCPDEKTLRNMGTMSIWAEGVAGKVQLDVKQIAATGCKAATTTVEAAAAACTSYTRVEGATCAEVCLGSTVGICPTSLVAKIGKLSAGTCSALGYTVAGAALPEKAGPCGTLSFKTFTKAAAQVEAAAAAAGPCCSTCTAPLVKYYSVDHGFGHAPFCGEACMNPADFSKFHFFEKNLTRAAVDAGACARQFTPDGGHYSQYTKTVTHGVPHILSVTLDLYGEPAKEVDLAVA